jgi:hypothetical protein
MDKSLVVFYLKYFVLFSFVFEIFIVLKFFLQRINSAKEDVKSLMLIFYAGSFVALGLMIYYGLLVAGLDYIKLFVLLILGLVFAYLIFALFLVKYIVRWIVLFNNSIKQGDIVQMEDEFYRFLDFYKDKALLENFDGKVIQFSIFSLIHESFKPAKNLIWFYLPNENYDIDQIRQKIEVNPYVPSELIAVVKEEDLATRTKQLKVCIKDFADFKQIRELKKYLRGI